MPLTPQAATHVVHKCGIALFRASCALILQSLLDATGENLDPSKIVACMMQREKAGGHSERSIAIGTIEVALWDAVAKVERKPLHRVLAERFNGGKIADRVFCYVGGGWYFPGQTIKDLQDEMRRHLDAGYTLVKMKVGGYAFVRRFTPLRSRVASRRLWRPFGSGR